MAVSAWMVWRRHGFHKALGIFSIQLGLNLLWSVLFFGFRRPDLAFAEIVGLNLAILLTIISFWKLHRTAAILLLPYWAWVTFAAVLNFYLWRLNA